jgi:hypothetical protein
MIRIRGNRIEFTDNDAKPNVSARMAVEREKSRFGKFTASLGSRSGFGHSKSEKIVWIHFDELKIDVVMKYEGTTRKQFDENWESVLQTALKRVMSEFTPEILIEFVNLHRDEMYKQGSRDKAKDLRRVLEIW